MWDDIVKVEEIQSHRDLIYVRGRQKFSTGETQFARGIIILKVNVPSISVEIEYLRDDRFR